MSNVLLLLLLLSKSKEFDRLSVTQQPNVHWKEEEEADNLERKKILTEEKANHHVSRIVCDGSICVYLEKKNAAVHLWNLFCQFTIFDTYRSRVCAAGYTGENPFFYRALLCAFGCYCYLWHYCLVPHTYTQRNALTKKATLYVLNMLLILEHLRHIDSWTGHFSIGYKNHFISRFNAEWSAIVILR